MAVGGEPERPGKGSLAGPDDPDTFRERRRPGGTGLAAHGAVEGPGGEEVEAGDGWHRNGGTGRDEYDIGGLVAACLGLEPNLHAEPVELALVPGDESGEVSERWGRRRPSQLTAEAIASFEDRDLVAEFGRPSRGLHAGRTAADDEHRPRLGWRGHGTGLPSHLRVHGARDRMTVLEHAGAALHRCDARPDVGGLSGTRLGDPIRVGEEGASHGDRVDLPLRNRLLCGVGERDAPDADDRHRDAGADRSGEIQEHPFLVVEEGDGVRNRSVDAGRDEHRVGPGGDEPLCCRDCLGRGHPGLDEVRSVDPDDEREVGRPLADRLDDLGTEARPIVAVPIVAPVRLGREELLHEVAVGAVELDGIESGRRGAVRGGSERGHHLLDLDGRELARGDVHMHARGDR